MAQNNLVERIVRILDHTVVLDTPNKKLVALYILNSYVYEKFDFCPLLCITAPAKGCGKSTLAEVIASLVKTPFMTVNATSAAIFRIIERDKPCVIADETDTWSANQRQELSYVFNGGFSKANAKVLRCIQSGDDIKEYNVYCPKVIVGIGDFLSGTTKSRSLFISMKRKKVGDHIRRLSDFREDIEALKEELLAWSESYQPTLVLAKVDRNSDKLEAIKTIALELAVDINDIDISQREDDDPNDDEVMIRGIIELFEGVSFTTVSEIAQRLNQDERWEDLNYGRGVSNQRISKLLRGFDPDLPTQPYRLQGHSQPKRWVHIPTLRAKVSEYIDLCNAVTNVTHYEERLIA
ncbi:MAG: hypothetical protein CMI96_05870 [Pelagibacteraceae bacterium]|nr:hypothetical protein [Pelagibacteraceae bacterium]|tara:strand:+ start:423 stop:1475 length:1053 start_codon:yes stop_codon:yes gene_type:complete